MDSLPGYIEVTSCNSHCNVARLPTFKKFSSKCLEQTLERHVGAQSLLFTNLILFCLILDFSKENEILGIFQE